MNYLAHAFLSHGHPELLVGNFLGDLVTNKEMALLPTNIQKGIELHRFIDIFTDGHHAVENTVQLLHPYHHKYAPVVVDILYDFSLHENWDEYASTDLQSFANESYEIILNHLDYVPERRHSQVTSMISHNWLMGYGDMNHLHQTFMRVKKRARFPSQFENATKHLQRHKEQINDDFQAFFPEIIEKTLEFIAKM